MDTPASNSDKETPAGFRVVEISREPVELHKILKFEGMAASGGQAKVAVASGQVLVNGKVETRKRKKIISGDTIEFNGEKICVKLSLAADSNEIPPEVKVEQAPKEEKADRKVVPQ